MAGAGLTGFLGNLSGGEMIVILIVALVVLGPERLPEMARGAGRTIHKLKTMTEGFQSEVRDVMDDPSMQPLRELGELAARPRQKLTEYALEAEAEERARKEAERHAQHEAAVAEAEGDGSEDSEPGPGSTPAGATAGGGAVSSAGAAVGTTDDGHTTDAAGGDADDAAGAGGAGAPEPGRPDPARLGPLVAAVEQQAARARAAEGADRVDGQGTT